MYTDQYFQRHDSKPCTNQMGYVKSVKKRKKLSSIYFLTAKNILLGYNNKNKKIENICNFIIQEGKFQIWKNRNNVKYGKKESLSNIEIEERIIKTCKEEIEIFVNISHMNHKVKYIKI